MKRSLKKGVVSKFKAEPQEMMPEQDSPSTAVEAVKQEAVAKKGAAVGKKRGGINKHRTISGQ